MKKWLGEYKKSIILSTVLTLVPMLIGLVLWNRLPDSMTIHWNAGGVENGQSGKFFAVFGLPVILAGLNLVGMVATAADPRQAKQSKKAMGMIFWIMPVISFAVSSVMYTVAMGKPADIGMAVFCLMGVLFVVMGNYMPKVQQNSTLGLKISWTLGNEENWNKTHRFAGRVWVGCGLVFLPMALLPIKWIIPVLVADMLVMIVAPMVYSYRIYRMHKAQGIVYNTFPGSKNQKRISGAILVVILAGVAVLMLAGEIEYTCGESALQIEANFTADLSVAYADMDEIELREDFSIGMRTMGFSSVRLSTGSFRNEELGDYTLYAYSLCDSMILIRSGEDVLAVNAETSEETQELYEILTEKLQK